VWAARSWNLQSNCLGASESDEAGFGVLDDGVAEACAGAGAEVDDAARNSGLLQDFDELGGDGGSVAGGFRTTVLPVTMAAAVMPAIDGKGEVPGGDDGADTEGM